MKNLILKTEEGDLFRFTDTEERTELTIGSKRTADIVVKSQYVEPMQIRLILKNNVWYAEDLTPEDAKSEVFLDGRRFKRPMVKFDGVLPIRRAAKKEKADIVRISAVKQFSRKKPKNNFDLTAKTITTVGSGEGCDIRVNNPLVSEKHFFIVFDGQNCYVEDAHSVSGTYVNNKKVKRQKLNDYDRLSIPSAAYIFYRNALLFSTAEGGIRIDAVDVCKRVQDRNARGKISLVTNVTFRIGAGEFVAVVGGSGAGKSTLLDCINGMRPATDGKIYYDTNDYYENMNTYKGVVGYVPQRDIMHDDLTLWDALRYTALLRTRADLSMEMMELLKDLSKKGRTIVVITHAMENIDKCDRVAFLGRGGRLCYYGAAKDAFRWFNRRSYSRIFAALADEETSEAFAKKYRRTDYYKELYGQLVEEYGKGCCLPPEAETENEAAWEKAPKRLPRRVRTARVAAGGGTAREEAAAAQDTRESGEEET